MIHTMTQHALYLHTSLRATFGGNSCPYNWSILSESIANLANLLTNNLTWDPYPPLSNTTQDPTRFSYAASHLFCSRSTNISPHPIDWCMEDDVYIDDTTTITLDEPSTLEKYRSTVPLAIHIVGRPLATTKPVPCVNLISESKLISKGSMVENKLL